MKTKPNSELFQKKKKKKKSIFNKTVISVHITHLRKDKPMTDIYTNEKPFGLMGEEMQVVMQAHFKAGGKIKYFRGSSWTTSPQPSWARCNTYRAVRPTPTPDVIAWKLLPDWVQSVARDEDGKVWAYGTVKLGLASRDWFTTGASAGYRRIDDFPGLVQIGTCDWKDSKQTRPEGV